MIFGTATTNITLSTIWPLIAVIATGIGGAFGWMAHLISDLRKDNQELTSKVMDQVIPALQQSTQASKEMIAQTANLSQALAVAEDRRRR